MTTLRRLAVAFVVLATASAHDVPLAKANAVVGTLGKIRPPVSLNGTAVTPRHDRKRPLHVGDVIHCGKGGDVTMTISGYVVHPPCPSDYPIPNVAGQTDPAPALKEGAIVGVYKVKPVPNCGSASTSVIARGGGDVAQAGHYTGVTCACPADVLNGQFCVDNESRAVVWYVRARPLQASGSSSMQLLPAEHEIVHGEVYQFEVPTNAGKCVYTVTVEFDNGTSAQWPHANLCTSTPLEREWEVDGPGLRR